MVLAPMQVQELVLVQMQLPDADAYAGAGTGTHRSPPGQGRLLLYAGQGHHPGLVFQVDRLVLKLGAEILD